MTMQQIINKLIFEEIIHMNKINWKQKLSSRKLWIAVAGFVSGLILAFDGAESTAATVSGCILQGAAVIGYLLAEGLTDAEGVKNGNG